MIDPETRAHIRHKFFAEHWKIGTIAQAFKSIFIVVVSRNRSDGKRAQAFSAVMAVRASATANSKCSTTRAFTLRSCCFSLDQAGSMGFEVGRIGRQIKQLRTPTFDHRTYGRDFVGTQVVEDHDVA